MNTAAVLEETAMRLVEKIDVINPPLQKPTERQLWEELVFCILGSRVKHETAESAFRRLRACGFLSLTNRSLGKSSWQKSVRSELRKSLFLPLKLDGQPRKYPFAGRRSYAINRSFILIYGSGKTLMSILSDCGEPKKKRIALIRSVNGMGPKQASLFLRNVGFGEDIAILDSHILRYMSLSGLIVGSSTVVQGLSRYEHIEECLVRYAQSLKTKLSKLDLAIWITMRAFAAVENGWVS
jgi:N-glycosylase/DNA lyase